MVFSYIAKFVEKIKSQLKLHILDTKDPISVIGFLSTIKLACDANCILKGSTMLVLPQYVNETIASALDSRMVAKDKFTPITVSVRNYDTRSRKLHCPCPEVANYLLKKFPSDQAIAEADAAIFLYMQPSNTTPQQYPDDLVS